MSKIIFPDSPDLNDSFVFNKFEYTWDGKRWRGSLNIDFSEIEQQIENVESSIKDVESSIENVESSFLQEIEDVESSIEDVESSFLQEIEEVTVFFTATVTGSNGTSDWTGSDPYIATLTVNGIKATDRPVVSLDVSNESFEDGIFLQREWNFAYRVEASADNEIKVYAVEEPLFTLNLLIKVVR